MRHPLCAILCLIFIFSLGCESVEQNQNIMRFLQTGKARGHLVVTSDGAVKAGMRNEFFAGADGTTISFDGNIDFGSTEPESDVDEENIE